MPAIDRPLSLSLSDCRYNVIGTLLDQMAYPNTPETQRSATPEQVGFCIQIDQLCVKNDKFCI